MKALVVNGLTGFVVKLVFHISSIIMYHIASSCFESNVYVIKKELKIKNFVSLSIRLYSMET
jgi:hypothetical protein